MIFKQKKWLKYTSFINGLLNIIQCLFEELYVNINITDKNRILIFILCLNNEKETTQFLIKNNENINHNNINENSI
ncbi:hypothetical protein H8356DRAFT_1336189 [Neocallimastix lanati (nom. inval.)]|nr:hypothetical protein H8356DRAFT_1336189 [Neocallimastix sp. JGI-2020a]